MRGWPLLRWARVRTLAEASEQTGPVQSGRVEVNEAEARDGVPRPQDYGFAAQPVDGSGLRIEAGGHTIILRLDRTAERPALAAYEVCVWHKEGHRVTLKAGRVVQVDCDEYIVNTKTYKVSAEDGVEFNTESIQAIGATLEVDAIKAASSLKVANVEVLGHAHAVPPGGGGSSGPMVAASP